MVMLHIVILDSIDKLEIASPVYSIVKPVPPDVPILPIIYKIKSLEVTKGLSFPSTCILKFLSLFKLIH